MGATILSLRPAFKSNQGKVKDLNMMSYLLLGSLRKSQKEGLKDQVKSSRKAVPASHL